MRPAIVIILLLAVVLLGLAGFAAGETPADHVITYTAWTHSSLVVGLRADDPMVVGNQIAPMSEPWLDDAVAVYLDLDPTDGDALNENCVRVVISAAGGATVQRGKNGVWVDDPLWFQPNPLGTIRYGVQVNGKINDAKMGDKGYTVEMALAWPLLGVAPPELKQRGALPTIGYAVVCYSQGETQAISCWPPSLTENDLSHPARWGRLQFLQSLQPTATTGALTSATRLPGEPVIDGKLDGFEWMTSGIITIEKQMGIATTPVEPAKQAVSLVAAWYVLDPTERPGGHQPLDPAPPEMGPDTPLYHLIQLQEMRRAGIDAIAVLLPVEAAKREQTRTRLAALVNALREHDSTSSSPYFTDTPLLMPLLDIRAGANALSASQTLDDFYRLTPPQFRLMAPDASGQWRYPVAGIASTGDDNAYPPLNLLGLDLQQKYGRPIGWLLDTAWPEQKNGESVIGHCSWDPLAGVQIGEGAVRAALITPGFDAGGIRVVSRRGGDFYNNCWLKVANAWPDLVIIRSWNDLAQSTEIASSRQFGAGYLDATRLQTIKLVQDRKYGLRLLQHNLPAVLAAGRRYPVDLIVKNVGTQKIAARAGFHVDYRLMQGDRQVARGTATNALAVMELSAARLHFVLSTSSGRQELPPGQYTLCLDFKQNKLPQFSVSVLSKNVWTLSIPFTIAAGSEMGQATQMEIPQIALAGQSVPAKIWLRYPEKNINRRTRLAFLLSWSGPDGTMLGDESPLTTKTTPQPGEIAEYGGNLPPAPRQPGWYQVCLQVVRDGASPVTVSTALVQVVERDLRGQFLSINLPERISDGPDKVEVPAALRNPGLTDWPAQQTAISYQWQRWDGRPIAGGNGVIPLEQDVKAGAAAAIRIMLPLPSGAGPMRCAFGLLSGGQAMTLLANPVDRAYPVCTTLLRPERYYQIDLSAAYTAGDSAAVEETLPVQAGLDGAGNLFPVEEFLPDATRSLAGYAVGYGMESAPAEFRDVPFFFPFEKLGRLPVARAGGQAIKLPETTGSFLYLAAINLVKDGPCALTIHYTAGEDQTVALNISNWLDTPKFGEPVLLRTNYLRTLHGQDRSLHASVFAYRISLDPQRKAATLMLPKQPEVCVFAATMTP